MARNGTHFRKRLPPIGSRPGTLAIDPDSPPTQIELFDYKDDVCTEVSIDDPRDLAPYVSSPRITWVDVQGLGDEAKLRVVAELFKLDRLTLEDATNVPQRAKSEVHSDHHVIVARAPQPEWGEHGIQAPQVFLLIGPNYLVTFQDRCFGFFDGVRDRIRDGAGVVRKSGPDYLAYALLDSMVDHYFPVLNDLSERLEDVEEDLHQGLEPETLQELHTIRRALVTVRRVGWPQREALRYLTTEPSPFISDQVRQPLRHVEQQMTQVMEAIDAARDNTAALLDLYITNLSNRTNEVMKVLTLMASIFIPLTFIAGIYGMNFEHMPELHSRWGYFAVLGVMVAVAMGMILFFRRKGWIG